MTTIEQPADVASAAASGASATERFHADKSPYAAVKDTPTERVVIQRPLRRVLAFTRRSMVMASAAAVPSSRSEALATESPVRSQIMV